MRRNADGLRTELAAYYERTASWYDEVHIHEDDEHTVALRLLCGMLAKWPAASILDIGSGTGRGMLYLQKMLPDARVVGVEPVEKLRALAVSKGCKAENIIAGMGESLPFGDKSFDCVVALGILHHVPDPRQVIQEMLRVSKKVIAISDVNIYGWGTWLTTTAKRWIRRTVGASGFQYLVTRGRGYFDTDYDGIWFPFSLLDHVDWMNRRTDAAHLATTKGIAGRNFNQTSHLFYFGLLKQ